MSDPIHEFAHLAALALVDITDPAALVNAADEALAALEQHVGSLPRDARNAGKLVTRCCYSFAAHRWAQATKTPHGAVLRYGVGKVCSKSVALTSYMSALKARTDWLLDGVEPQRTLTRRDWPPVTDAMLDIAAEQLEANRS